MGSKPIDGVRTRADRLGARLEAFVRDEFPWVALEPNGEPLWARVRRSLTDFLMQQWRDGALEGRRPEEAFFVKADRSTMTQADLDSGRLVAVVGGAIIKPAEFVVFRIILLTASVPADPCA